MAKKLSDNKLFIILLSMALLISALIGITAMGESTDVTVLNASGVSYTDMEAGQAYYFDELVVFDHYAAYGTDADNASTEYYLVGFVDGNGNSVYVSMSVDPDSDLGKKCSAYCNDSTQLIGDLVLSGCFKASQFSNELGPLFNKIYTNYNAQLPAQSLHLNFSYKAATGDEYIQQTNTSRTARMVIAPIVAIAAAVGIVALVRKRKQLKAELNQPETQPEVQ